MMRWFYRRLIRRMERRYDYDATYMHDLIGAAPEAFRRFAKVQLAARWQGTLPRDAWWCAAIGAVVHEDCGPCVQIATDQALEAGVEADTIAALLQGRTVGGDAQLGFDFARALLSVDETLDEHRAAAEMRWGIPGVAALTLMAISARNFPTMKRALGHAKACQRIKVGASDVVVAPALKAAA